MERPMVSMICIFKVGHAIKGLKIQKSELKENWKRVSARTARVVGKGLRVSRA